MRRFVWWSLAAVAGLVVVVVVVRVVRDVPAVAQFIRDNPGTVETPGAPVGIPAWLGWQHFLNGLFLLLIVKAGWEVRTVTRPAAYWRPRRRSRGRPGAPAESMSLSLWLHLTVDVLWVVNGAVFVVLLFATGQWQRIVPTSWEIFPNAASVAVQYASLDWPAENGWVSYNALQVLAYFSIVFIAAPLAVVSGLRISPMWSARFGWIGRLLPLEVARRMHFAVMIYFVGFTITHVALVASTGLLQNLNHMYAQREGAGLLGLGIFAASLLVMIATWVLARPIFLRPVAAAMGTVSRGP